MDINQWIFVGTWLTTFLGGSYRQFHVSGMWTARALEEGMPKSARCQKE